MPGCTALPGDADVPLSPRGREQAVTTASRLVAHGPFDLLVTSPFARARQTAEASAQTFGLEPVEEPGLREFLMAPEGAADDAAMGRAWALAREHWAEAPPEGESVVAFHARVGATLGRAGLADRVMIDCSHGNSSKDYTRQPEVALDLAGQVAEGNRSIIGIMLESFLEDYEPVTEIT